MLGRSGIRPPGRVRNYLSTIVGYSGSMGIRPDDSKKAAVRALRGRHALLNAYIDILNRLDGPSRRLPEISAKSAIPTREPQPARNERRLAAYPHEGHVAALTARLRNFSPL
jgi:hypothetical protein